MRGLLATAARCRPSAYYEAKSGFIGIDTVVLLFSTSDGQVRQESWSNINGKARATTLQ